MASEYRLNPNSALFEEAECKTNWDNVKYMIVLSAIMLLCDALNEAGVFEVSRIVMRIGTALGMAFYLTPTLVLLRPFKLFKNQSGQPYYRSWHKYLIIAFAWLGTTVSCMMLTHHTVIAMAIPIMIMAQYRNTVSLIPVAISFGTVCVLLGVYGGYFWGCFDANLLRMGLTDENVSDLAIRLQMATPERMRDLLTHYALPREMVVMALILLAAKISKRNNEMLRQQATLQTVAESEMQRANDIQIQIIDGMANLIENRDTSTGEHVKRTSYYVKSIVEGLKADSVYADELSDGKADTIVRAAPLHDIGKIIVSDRILQKPGKLTPDEYEEIKQHAVQGAKVIQNVLGNVEDENFLHVAMEIAGSHHERWDGKGYPQGLSNDSIPLSARIMAVADVFDALISKRVYKEPIPLEDAFTIIEKESGKQFDPEVVNLFLSRKPQISLYLGTDV